MKMVKRAKLALLIVCTASLAPIWVICQLFPVTLKENKVNREENKRPCSCSTCMSEFNTFFMARYDKSVKPFLTPLDNFTQENFQWWKLLQSEMGDLSTFQKKKERLFNVFPSKPDLTEPDPAHCRMCAVVGNSGNLKGSKYGSQIDAHDIVIRMNFARTTGYEEDVGAKTTHHAMYPETAIDLDNTTHLVLFPFKILDLQWITDAFTAGFRGRSYAAVKAKVKANKNLVMIVNPAFMKYVHTSWLNGTGKYPSTGFMTVVLAMHICDQVKVFGFGADKNGNWNHYWEELEDKNLKTGVHPGTDEYGLIQDLAKQNKVTFYKGW